MAKYSKYLLISMILAAVILSVMFSNTIKSDQNVMANMLMDFDKEYVYYIIHDTQKDNIDGNKPNIMRYNINTLEKENIREHVNAIDFSVANGKLYYWKFRQGGISLCKDDVLDKTKCKTLFNIDGDILSLIQYNTLINKDKEIWYSTEQGLFKYKFAINRKVIDEKLTSVCITKKNIVYVKKNDSSKIKTSDKYGKNESTILDIVDVIQKLKESTTSVTLDLITNIYNVFVVDDNIYFIASDSTMLNGYLCRYNTITKKIDCVIDKFISQYYATDETILFVLNENLYKINIDGTSGKMLRQNVTNFMVNEEKIYFDYTPYFGKLDYYLYSMNLDGTDEILIDSYTTQ